MTDQELAQQVYADGMNLHVSLRGTFLKALNYPGWRKKYSLLFLSGGRSKSSREVLEASLAPIKDMPPTPELEDWSTLKLLKTLLLGPLVLLFMAPFFVDVFRPYLIWNADPAKLFYALLLGTAIKLDEQKQPSLA